MFPTAFHETPVRDPQTIRPEACWERPGKISFNFKCISWVHVDIKMQDQLGRQ